MQISSTLPHNFELIVVWVSAFISDIPEVRGAVVCLTMIKPDQSLLVATVKKKIHFFGVARAGPFCGDCRGKERSAMAFVGAATVVGKGAVAECFRS